MDYKQSIKNLNHLKNFIQAWDYCHIFFFFNSETEFEIEIYDSEWTNEQQEKIDKNLRSPMPYALIKSEECAEDILYYTDQNLTARYDFLRETISDIFFHDPIDEKAAQKQFQMLIKLLENK